MPPSSSSHKKSGGNDVERGALGSSISRYLGPHSTPVEINNRASFIDFCKGLLDMNPVTRWSPVQARQHPFITGDKFVKPYVVRFSVPLAWRILTNMNSARSDPILPEAVCHLLFLSACSPATTTRPETSIRWLGTFPTTGEESIPRCGDVQPAPLSASSVYRSAATAAANWIWRQEPVYDRHHILIRVIYQPSDRNHSLEVTTSNS